MAQISKEKFLELKEVYQKEENKDKYSYLEGEIRTVEETEETATGLQVRINRPGKDNFIINLSYLNIIYKNTFLRIEDNIEVIVEGSLDKTDLTAVLFHNYDIRDEDEPYFTKNSIPTQ